MTFQLLFLCYLHITIFILIVARKYLSGISSTSIVS